MRAGQALCDDPALALHFGEACDISEMSVVGLLGGACADMTEGLALTNRYARLIVEVETVGSGDRFVLECRGRRNWLIDNRTQPNDFPELTESTFARMICTVRRHFGQTQLFKAVHVTHAEPGYRDEYERIFQAPVIFGSDLNELMIDGQQLTQSVFGSPYLHRLLSSQANQLLRELENSKSTTGRVESLLISILHTGGANIDTVSDKLGLSRQTLFRRLKAEGTTFEKILKKLRHRLAVYYLSGEKVSVNEAAYRLGFSDPAAFSRAFKRWTGLSPRTARSSKVDNGQTDLS